MTFLWREISVENFLRSAPTTAGRVPRLPLRPSADRGRRWHRPARKIHRGGGRPPEPPAAPGDVREKPGHRTRAGIPEADPRREQPWEGIPREAPPGPGENL